MSVKSVLEIVGIVVAVIVGIVTVSCQVEQKIELTIERRVGSRLIAVERQMEGLERDIDSLRQGQRLDWLLRGLHGGGKASSSEQVLVLGEAMVLSPMVRLPSAFVYRRKVGTDSKR